MTTMKFNVRVSVANQARVFNVVVTTECASMCYTNVVNIAERFAPQYCTVVVSKGCKKHRGKAMSLLDLTIALKSLHFYKYVEREIKEEKFIPLETFYKAPFIPDYNPFIDATFMHNVAEDVMPNVEQGLKDLTLLGNHIYLAKSGYWYCWGKLDYRWIEDGRFQIGVINIETKTIKVKEEIA